MRGKFVIIDRRWAGEKDEKNNKIYIGLVRYEGQGRFDGQTAEIRIPYTPNTKAGRVLDDVVSRANHGLEHVQDDFKIKNMEELMRAAGRSYSARLMRKIDGE
jgi:hypothetical protein